MPRGIATTSTKRTTRPRAAKKNVSVKEVEPSIMPPTYNPSDDEDEYQPATAKKTPRTNKRKQVEKDDTPAKKLRIASTAKTPSTSMISRTSSTVANASSVITPAKRSRISSTVTKTPSTAAEKSRTAVAKSTTAATPVTLAVEVKKEMIKKEPGEDESKIKCPMNNCDEKITIDGNARFHISTHYFIQKSSSMKNILEPVDDDAKSKVYQCKYEKCIRRKMIYKEMVFHLLTQHQQLAELMKEDTNPVVQQAMYKIFPGMEPHPAPIKIKTEVSDDAPDTAVFQHIVDDADSENVDDPVDASPAAPTQTPTAPAAIKVPEPVKTDAETSRSMAPSMSRVMNCFLCTKKDGKNLDCSKSELKYHISCCLYPSGELLRLVDPKGQNHEDFGTPAFEEFGHRFKYKCTVEGCDKGSVKAKQTGYKELAIHTSMMHGVLERWAEQSQVKGAQELYQILRMRREDQGQSLQDVPEISVEELHTCLLCDGEDKEGFCLSLHKDKLYGTRYHYANCLTNQKEKLRQLVQMYPPERHNLTQEGLPQDMVGKVFKYNCTVSGCTRTQRRKLGYKEFVIHMCCDHGGLEDILAAHEEEKVRKMIPKLKFQNNK